MGIARFENIDVNNVTNGKDTFGQYTTTITKWFTTRAKVHSVKNSLNITTNDRVYTDLINFTLNYTPNIKEVVNNQNLYSITWRGFDWRINSTTEADDRMSIVLYCYRNDPVTPV